MTGHLGYESTGLNALRGQNNVQGLNDSGANPMYLPGYQSVDDPEIRRRFSEAWGAEVPETAGYRLDQMMSGLHDGRVEALVSHRREPGADRAERAPRRGGPREARLPDLAGHLPARHDAEVRGRRLPRVELRGEGRHVHEHRAPHQPRARGRAASRRREGRPRDRLLMAKALGANWPEYPDAESVWNELADLAPELVRRPLRPDRGERHPVAGAGDRPSGNAVPARARARAATGRGKFFPVEYQRPIEEPDSEYPLVLSTGRTLYHYNSATMTMRESGITDKQEEPFFEISAEDASALGLGRRRLGAARLASRRARGADAHLGPRLPRPRLDGAPLRRAEGELAHARRRRPADRDARVQGRAPCASSACDRLARPGRRRSAPPRPLRQAVPVRARVRVDAAAAPRLGAARGRRGRDRPPDGRRAVRPAVGRTARTARCSSPCCCTRPPSGTCPSSRSSPHSPPPRRSRPQPGSPRRSSGRTT